MVTIAQPGRRENDHKPNSRGPQGSQTAPPDMLQKHYTLCPAAYYHNRMDGSTARILVVDDAPEVRLLVRGVLESECFTVGSDEEGWIGPSSC